MKNKSILFYILGALALILFASCAAEPPMESPKDALPYLIPEPPENVRATKTDTGRIKITWDPSPTKKVSSYQILYTDSASYTASPTFKKTPQIDGKKDGNEYIFEDATVGSSYVFAVVALRDIIGQHAEILQSQPSEFAEGATLGVPHITGITRQSGIILSWSVDNFFSVLSSREGKSIYDWYDFVVSYRPENSEIILDVARTTDLRAVIPPHGTDLTGEITYTLSDKINYEFFVTMNIYETEDDMKSGTPMAVSKAVPVNVKVPATSGASDLISLTGDSGKNADGIMLHWKAPIIIGMSQEEYQSVFRVERKEAGSDEWKTIVREKESLEKVTMEVPNEVYSFFDTTAEPNKSYEYRVTNGFYTAPAEGQAIGLYTLHSKPHELSEPLHRIWVPTSRASASYEKYEGNDIQGTVTVRVPVNADSFHEIEDAEWKLEMLVWHLSPNGVKADPIVTIEQDKTVPLPPTPEGAAEKADDVKFGNDSFTLNKDDPSEYVITYGIGLPADEEKYTHLFEFRVVYENKSENGNNAKATIAVDFPDDNKAQIGTHVSEKLYDNLHASINRVGEIEITWDEVYPDPGKAALTRAYEVYIGEKVIDDKDVTVNEGHGSMILSGQDLADDLSSYEIRLVCYEGEANHEGHAAVYIDPVAVHGSVLKAPVITASRGTSIASITVEAESPLVEGISEEEIKAAREDIRYEIEYKLSDSEEWKVLTSDAKADTATDKIATAIYEENDDSRDGLVHSFRAKAWNVKQGDQSKTKHSSEAEGAVFGGANMSISASVAEDAEHIRIDFTRAVGADTYRIERKDGESWVDLGLKPSEDGDFFIDNKITKLDRSAMYDYRVVPVSKLSINADEASLKESAGSLFMPPENIKASKGLYPGEVLVEWSPAVATEHDGKVNEKAAGYAVIAYTEAQKSSLDTYDETMVKATVKAGDGSEAWNAEKGVYQVKVPVTTERGVRTWYSVVSLNSNATASLPQNLFSIEDTEVRTKIESNIGYSKQPSILDVNVVNQFDPATKMLRDAILVTWKRVDSARLYKIVNDTSIETEVILDISSIDWSKTVEVSIASNNKVEVYNNGLKYGNPGYFQYEPIEEKYTYFDNAGIMDGTKLHISKYEIIADLDPEGKVYDDVSYGQAVGRFQRQFKPEEMINITNTFLHKQIDTINADVNNDWWPDFLSGGGDVNLNYPNGVSVKLRRVAGYDDFVNESFIKLTDVNVSDWVFDTSDGNTEDLIRLGIRAYSMGSQYEDHLQHIGNDGHGTVFVTPPSAWRPFSVNYNGVRGAASGNGQYKVTSNGKTVTVEDVNNPRILNRPYTWRVTDL